MDFVNFLMALSPIVVVLVGILGFKKSAKTVSPAALLWTLFLAFTYFNLDGATFAENVKVLDPLVWKGIKEGLKIVLMVFGAFTILNLLRETGAIEDVKSTIAQISDDRRVQVVIIGMMLPIFLEGAAGAGAPAAIAAPFLVALGFQPATAIAVALLGDATPASWGGAGLTTINGGAALVDAGLSTVAQNSAMVGRFHMFGVLIIPFIMVGMGHVGAHVAYALAIQGIADELVLVDQNEQKLASEVQDLRDAVAYMPHRVTVRGGGFSDLGVCDVIVNSVGKIDLLRGTHDRLTEMDFTIPAVRGYAEKIKASGFDGVLINITNPCDIVTRELALHLGLPRGRVFGTGTGLDTSRLLSALARQTGLDHKSITCYMLGEHGNQQFAPWSCVSFRGVPLDTWAKTDERFRFDREALQKESIGGGWVTFAGKFCTEYGIATTAARMAYAVLHDEKVILPASAELCGEYGEEGLFAGVPCVIGENGVEQVVELPLTESEQASFHACCEGIRRNMEHLKEI